jgi:hypothetical protein
MRALFLATPILAGVLISNSMTAEADPLVGPATAPAAGAPVVHVQPRAKDFYPHSAASEAEQSKLFDVRRETTEAGRGAGQEIEHLPLLIFPKLHAPPLRD